MILIFILIGGMGFGARDLISKNDTNIIGSIVAGNKVIADIGGDLNSARPSFMTDSGADLIRDSAVNYLQGLAAQEIKKLADSFKYNQ